MCRLCEEFTEKNLAIIEKDLKVIKRDKLKLKKKSKKGEQFASKILL